MRKYISIVFKTISFLIIGIFLFAMIQNILMPKRAPYTKAYDAGKLAGFYNEEEHTIDVLICSTSHISKSILPMELYEDYGITSYNLSTSTQPIEATYYILAEALKTQSPEVFIIDVSNLYFSSVEAKYWWFVLDEMRLGENKTALLQEYKRSANGGNESKGELLFPLLRYHERWKELRMNDFMGCLRGDIHDYSKGGQVNSAVSAADVTVGEMNLAADQLLESTQKIEYVYDAAGVNEKIEDHALYHSDIPEKNIEWLRRMKALCDENNIQLLAVKVPTVFMPQLYNSSWIEEKYHQVRTLCNEEGITYYDLLYDTDAGIDWETDTSDEGLHLNLHGAQKLSDNLGRYLIERCGLSPKRSEQWNRDLESYQKVRKVALLELERDFTSYLDMLANEFKDKTIIMSMANDGAVELNEADIWTLRALGLQADFSETDKNSYIAVIEGGSVKYEALSNRPLNYKGVCGESNTAYEVYSSGWLTGADTSIKLAGEEQVNNHKGLNIVVYDTQRELVLDSVNFDTSSEDHKARRSNSKTNGLEEQFEKYIIEEEYK